MSNTMISPEALIAEFRRALSEGWGYIWGTAGEKWTAAKQKELEKTTDGDRAQGRQFGSKWIGKTVADCSGLFSWAFRRLGGYMYHGSDTMYKKYCAKKGELKAGKRTDYGTLRPGTAVFVWNGRTYSHVGLYVGDNTVIEAMGTINGVTTTRVTAGKWTHWGELTGVDYENAQCIMHNAQSDSGSDRQTLKKGSKGQDVMELQTVLMKLGYDLGFYGADGDFGKDTEAAVRSFQRDYGLEADGIIGPLTRAELEKASSVIPTVSDMSFRPERSEVEKSPDTYSVTIFGLDLTQAKAIAANYPGNSEIERSAG